MERPRLLPPAILLCIVLAASSTVQAAREPGTLQSLQTPSRLPDTMMGGLDQLYTEYQEYRATPGTQAADFEPANDLLAVANGQVVIDTVATNAAADLLRDLKAQGLQGGASFGSVVSGWLPIDALDEAAKLPSLRFARPAYATSRGGRTTSQGDQAMRTDLVRNQFGLSGKGITVGVLSDSYNCLGGAADDLASGDLPQGVQVLREPANCQGMHDEGRAMLQLIHDVAPGAGLAFHTASNGIASFAEGIIALADAGADVVVDDIGYFSDAYFQDGLVAQAVNQVVARGIPYFSAAGNDAKQSYESVFRPGTSVTINGSTYLAHDFDPGPNVDTQQQITIPAGRRFSIVLQWDQPFASVSGAPGSTNDLDLFILNGDGTLLNSGRSNNIGRDPVEEANWTNQGSTAATVNLVIGRRLGANPTYLKYILPGSPTTQVEYATNSGTLFAHPNATGAIAVGAAGYSNTPAFGVNPAVLQSYSSRGGVPILFEASGARKTTPEVRPKPEIVGPDGTNTTFFPPASINPDADSDGDGFPNFSGTSAAAPHVAAATALLRELNPALTPAQIYTALTTSAADMSPDSSAFDFDSGYGFVRTDQAIASLGSNLDLQASVTPSSVAGGDRLNYTLVLANKGSLSAKNTTLTQRFSADVDVLSVTTGGVGTCSPSDRTIACKLGDLNGSAGITVTISAIPLITGTLVATIQASTDSTDINATNNSALITTTISQPAQQADLAIDLASSSSVSITAGAALSYSLSITNTGPDSAQNITTTLLLPAITSIGTASGEGWTCTTAAGSVTCSRTSAPVGGLPPISVQLTMPGVGSLVANARVQALTFDPGQANNRASVSVLAAGIRTIAVPMLQR